MKTNNEKSFIPRDKPKSWVLGILAGLIALVVASPIMFLGAYFKYSIIKNLGITLFVACWGTFAISWLIFFIGMLGGKYKNIQEQDWSEQLW